MKVIYIGAFLGTMLLSAVIQEPSDLRSLGKLIDFCGSYSWSETIVESGRSTPTRIEGRADECGVTAVSVVLANRTIEGFILGHKAYVTCAQKNWKTEPLLAQGESPGALMTRLIRSVTPPAQEIDFLLNNGKNLKKGGEILAGELTESVAKRLFEDSEKRLRKVENGDRKSAGIEAKSTRGNVTLWTKDDVVTKYEIRLTGKIDVDGEETEIVRTRTVEIKDIGTTKIDLPEKARQKLGL